MTILGGKFGVVNSYSTVRNWSINLQQTASKFVASNTQGGTGRRQSVRSWTGSFGAYGVIPTVLPGSSFTFTGYTGPTNGVSGSGVTYSGTAYVDSIVLTWDWSAGAVLSHVVNFSGHLALTKGTGTNSDATDPDVPVVCGTKVTYDSSGDVEWPNLVSAALTLNTPSQAYVNSSTIASGVCWTGRRPGILDWTLALTEQNEDTIAATAIGSDLWLKLWADGTDYYDLKWGHVESHTGLTVDRETNAIIQKTVNISMNGFVGGDVGNVILPGEVTALWPPA